MKKLIFVLLLFFFFISHLFAQDTYEIKEAWDFFQSDQLQTGGWRTVLSEENIQGSPYLNSDFIKGTIFTRSKEKFVNVPLRYNIFNDELEFQIDENTIQAIATPGMIEKAEFGDYTLVYTNYSSLNKEDKGFLQVLVDGDANLLLKSEVVFREPKGAAAFKEPVPARFIKKTDCYYIQVGDEIPARVRGKKEIIKLFPEHQNEISLFIKEKNIKLKNSESLMELINYYNTL